MYKSFILYVNSKSKKEKDKYLNDLIVNIRKYFYKVINNSFFGEILEIYEEADIISEIDNFICVEFLKKIEYFKSKANNENSFKNIIAKVFKNYIYSLNKKKEKNRIYHLVRKIFIETYNAPKDIKGFDIFEIDKIESEPEKIVPKFRGKKQICSKKEMKKFIKYLFWENKGKLSINDVVNKFFQEPIIVPYDEMTAKFNSEDKIDKEDESDHNYDEFNNKKEISDNLEENLIEQNDGSLRFGLVDEFNKLFTNKKERMVLYYHFLDDYKIKDISSQFDITPQNISYYKNLITEKIKGFIEKNQLSQNDVKKLLENFRKNFEFYEKNDI